MTDYDAFLKLTERTVTPGDATTVALQRLYDAPIDDVWDAVTSPERIARWFLPVTGDLRLGGKYQLEGNAGGEIIACEPPRMFRATWVFGEEVTEVEVRLSAVDDDRTRFELAHTAVVDPAKWAEFGPGAVGVGWDSILLGLSLHLGTGKDMPADKVAWMSSPEGKRFMTTSSDLWGQALLQTGADPQEVATMVERTTKAYTG